MGAVMQFFRVVCVSLLLSGCLCAPGELQCGSQCIDRLRDPANCGACGVACDYLCTAGACVPRPECGPAALRADCDDGDACNGTERCDVAAGRCVRGTAMDCRDTVACTRDSCSAGSCTHTPADSMCAPDEACDSAAGCQRVCPSLCDPVTPMCGCGAGESCYVTASIHSCEVEGSRIEGQVCGALDDCESGTGCFLIEGTSVATCRRYCRDASHCDVGGCIGGGTIDTADAELGLCSMPCDLRSSAGCPSGTKCGITGFITECIAVGTGNVGTVCSSHSSCRSGLLCVGTSPSGICREWCRIGHDTDCGSSFSFCSALSTHPFVDGVEHGYCR